MVRFLSTLADTFREVQKSVADVRNNAIKMIHDIRQDARGTVANITHELLETLQTLSHRVDQTIFAITIIIALSLLLRLSYFSSLLRTIAFILFAGFCICLIIGFLRRYSSDLLPMSDQYSTLVPRRNLQLEETIAQSNIGSEVDLIKRQLNDDDMKMIVDEIVIKKQCTKLRLGWNDITPIGASILADALVHNSTLQELSLWQNHLGDAGTQSFTTAISINKNVLKKIDFSNNRITDMGAAHLAEMLKTNKILTHLSLSNNEITDAGVQLLADALVVPDTLRNRNRSLQKLSFSSNKSLTDASVVALTQMINYQQSLTTLWVNDCNLSPTSKAKLTKTASSKHHLKVHV